MIEPGSAIKPFVIAKALDAGKTDLNERLNTQPYKIGPSPVRDDTHVYPSLDVRGIMQKSSNVGTSKLSARFGVEEMYDFYHGGHRCAYALGLSGETAGLLRNWRRWRYIEQATMSFGYSIQLSLLQLARAYTALTHDGVLLPPALRSRRLRRKANAYSKNRPRARYAI